MFKRVYNSDYKNKMSDRLRKPFLKHLGFQEFAGMFKTHDTFDSLYYVNTYTLL